MKQLTVEEAEAKAKADKEAAEKAERERKLAEVEKFFTTKCTPDGEARTRDESVSCGDLFKLRGNGASAIARWREALSGATIKGEETSHQSTEDTAYTMN